MATDKTGSGTGTLADPKASEAKAADAKADDAKSTATANAEVAAGHVVWHGEGDTRKKYKAGDTVTLPADEIERLRALGYLKPAEEPEPKPGTRTDAGVSVTSRDATSTVKPKGAT